MSARCVLCAYFLRNENRPMSSNNDNNTNNNKTKTELQWRGVVVIHGQCCCSYVYAISH